MPLDREIRVRGSAVSRGVGIGKAVYIFGDRHQFLRRNIAEKEIDSEISRYESALRSAKAALESDVATIGATAGERAAELLDAHLSILLDPELDRRIRDSIAVERANAEWAIQSAFVHYSDAAKRSSNDRFREKHFDFAEVADRLLSAVAGSNTSTGVEAGSVVATPELRASTLLQLRQAEVAAIVTEHGGWTSHSSILAREFGIPCVTGISRLFGYIGGETVAIVNGNTGEVVFDPSEASLAVFEEMSRGAVAASNAVVPPVDVPLQTLDGRRITLRTNTTSLETFEISKGKGALGIGLFRSEALISTLGRIPTEDEQYEIYKRIAQATGREGLRIRTFDVESETRQKNPALGLRAIRLGLQRKELLIPQLRAILRASVDNSIKIVIPMITDAAEMELVRGLILEQADELGDLGTAFGRPEIGAMVEIPSAALMAEQIAAAADFICLGTNDLAQYILAADRDNEIVADWFRTLHPAMLQTVKSVIDACRRADKPLVVCGEMAGSPFYVPVLIGMGAVELSVGPPSIEPVRRVVSGIAFEEAAELVRDVMKFTGPDEVELKVAETAKKKWLHLYPSGFFEQHGR